jgi:SAM-dependent methyltransferase
MVRKGKNKTTTPTPNNNKASKASNIPTPQSKTTKSNNEKSATPTPAQDKKTKSNANALSVDAANYRDTLVTYNKYAQQGPPQREWMKFKFGMKIRDMFELKKDVRVLAVGTGAGDVDIDFLNEIVHCGTKKRGVDGYSVTYQIIEPNTENVQAFRNRVAHKPEYNRVKFLWFTGSFDKFVADFRPRGGSDKFDLVHFVRCFHHMDSRTVLETTYTTLLGKQGFMCAIGENEEAFWPRLMKFLAQQHTPHERFTCSGANSQNYFLPGWLDLCRIKDWRYESYVQGYKFDVTPMYDTNNKDGNHLLDFAFHVKNARQNVPNKTVEDFMNFVNDGVKERLVVRNGVQSARKYYPCEMAAIMVMKE